MTRTNDSREAKGAYSNTAPLCHFGTDDPVAYLCPTCGLRRPEGHACNPDFPPDDVLDLAAMWGRSPLFQVEWPEA